MWAKTILNVENIVQMSDFIPNVGVISTVGKICYTAFYWEIRYQDLSFGQRSVVSSETWQASKHSRNIYAVWTFWAM